MKPQAPIIIVRRKGRHAAGHHGGAWKVAYADFVTAMMAFFLVMWLVSQSAETKAAVAGYFRNPGAFNQTSSTGILPGGGALGTTPGGIPRVTMTASPIDSAAAAKERVKLLMTADRIREDLLKVPEFGPLLAQIEIRVTSEGLRIELVEREGSSFFDSGSAVLRGESVRILALIARELTKLMNQVVIEGHTDSSPYLVGEYYGNWELSSDRANAARRVVERGGVPAAQMRGVRGYADTQLHFADAPFDPRNRRVSVVVRSDAVAAFENAIVTEGKPQVVDPQDLRVASARRQ
jgi:chemotaxis protein MotB